MRVAANTITLYKMRARRLRNRLKQFMLGSAVLCTIFMLGQRSASTNAFTPLQVLGEMTSVTARSPSHRSRSDHSHDRHPCSNLQHSKDAIEKWIQAARNRHTDAGCLASVSDYSVKQFGSEGASACDRYKWHGRPMYASTWEDAIPCSLTGGRIQPTSPADFSVAVVVTDPSLKHASELAVTWGAHAVRMGATLTFYASAIDASANMLNRTAVEAAGRLVLLGGEPGQDAQRLPLRVLRHLADHTNEDDDDVKEARLNGPRWLVLLTDQTHLALEEAAASLKYHEHRLQLLIGHIDAGVASWAYGGLQRDDLKVRALATRPAGTSGVILSMPAVKAIGRIALTSACPWPPADEAFAQRWDFVLGRCCWRAGVPQLHNPLMVPSMDATLGKNTHFDRNDPPLEGVISLSPHAGGRYGYLRSDGSDLHNDTLTWVEGKLRWKHDSQLFQRWANGSNETRTSDHEAGYSGDSSGSGVMQQCDVDTAKQALADWVKANQYQKGHYFASLTKALYFSLHRCVVDPRGDTHPRDFAVVVMASKIQRDRLKKQQRLWSRHGESLGAATYYICDEPDTELGCTVLSAFPNATNPTYNGAQHRSLRGLQHAVAKSPAARWYWLVDDDTYYSVQEAASLVRHMNHRVGVAVGFLWRGSVRFSNMPFTSISGGAGMLLSQAAAHAMAAALYTPACPFTRLNDLTIRACAASLGIPLVHSEALQPETEAYEVHDILGRKSFSELGGYVAIHRLTSHYDVTNALLSLRQFFKPANATEPFNWWVGAPAKGL